MLCVKNKSVIPINDLRKKKTQEISRERRHALFIQDVQISSHKFSFDLIAKRQAKQNKTTTAQKRIQLSAKSINSIGQKQNVEECGAGEGQKKDVRDVGATIAFARSLVNYTITRR